MKKLWSILIVGGAIGAGACGDNSKECGENTTLVDGRCVGTGGPPMCTDGTILDTASNSCVIDPNACQGGTVLIDNKCQDPTAGLTVDVTEGAEPNGAGFVEVSQQPAGILNLKPEGEPLVIKGTINPFRDADGDGQRDADYDLYFFEVNQPTLLDVTVDGVNGLMGAFVVLAADETNPALNTASGWIRYGMNVTGDMSKRQVFLPAAGAYAIVIADTRSMYLDASSPPAAGYGGAAGGPDAEYYATIKRVAMPAPTPIALTDGAGSVEDTIGSELKFYSAPLGTGFNEAVMMAETANPGIVVLRNGEYRASADQYIEQSIFGATLVPAEILALGFKASDTAVIVADYTYNYGPDPDHFTLALRASDGAALSRNGGTASQPVRSDAPQSFFDYSLFYYDVSAANEITGFDLAWSTPVDGLLVDEDLFIIGNFTYVPGEGFYGDTWEEYKGLIRHPYAGRYYFVVYDPFGDPETDTIEAESTIETVQAVAVTKGTPLTGQAVNTDYGTTPFTYTAGKATDPWQRFNASGDGTGDIELRFFNTSTAYGRLSPLDASYPPVDDVVPLFEDLFAEDGSAPGGRILLDDPTDTFLVLAVTENNAGTLDLDFAPEAVVNLGTIAVGSSVELADQELGGAVEAQRYIARTTAGNGFNITVSSQSDDLDTQFRAVAANLTTLAAFDDNGKVMAGNGWAAFVVTPVGTVATTEMFTLNVAAIAPGSYTVANGTSTYSDACSGGSTVPLVADGTGLGPANDEGLSAPIAPPPGFEFFGFAAPSFRVSSNGFLTFAPISQAYWNNADIPNEAAPNGLVAPYWDDLGGVSVCRKTVGNKLIIQWTGSPYSGSGSVRTQVILDGDTSTIELVYASNHTMNGASATIGVEDVSGKVAFKVGFNQSGVVGPSTSKLFTPAP